MLMAQVNKSTFCSILMAIQWLDFSFGLQQSLRLSPRKRRCVYPKLTLHSVF